MSNATNRSLIARIKLFVASVMPRRLSAQVPLFTVLILLVALSVTALVATLPLRNYLITQLDEDLQATLANGVRSADQLLSDSHAQAQPSPDPNEGLLKGGAHSWGVLQLVTLNNELVSSQVVHHFRVENLPGGDSGPAVTALKDQIQNPPNGPVSVSLPGMARYRLAHIYLVGNASLSGIPWRVFSDYRQARALVSQTDLDLLQITAGLPLEKIDNTVRWQLTQMALWGGGVILIGGACVWWMIRRQLAPLGRVAETAGQVSGALRQGQAPPGVRLSSKDADGFSESSQVGQALNTLLDQLSEAWKQRDQTEARLRQFVADASHELRTPLAAVRGYSQYLDQITQAAHAAHATQAEQEQEQNAAHAYNLPIETEPTEENAFLLTPQTATKRILSESERMSKLVEELLLLARLDSGVHLRRDPVDLAELCIEALQDAHVLSPEHEWILDLPMSPELLSDLDEQHTCQSGVPQETGNQHETSMPVLDSKVLDSIMKPKIDWPDFVPMDWRFSGAELTGAPLELTGDRARIYQLLTVLLSNARLHTPIGTAVTLSVRKWVCENAAWALVWVHDNGPGVPAELGERIFDRFVRADISRSNRLDSPKHSQVEQVERVNALREDPQHNVQATSAPYQSTGLGLSIARAIAQEHGGNLLLLPSENSGATFQISLPISVR